MLVYCSVGHSPSAWLWASSSFEPPINIGWPPAMSGWWQTGIWKMQGLSLPYYIRVVYNLGNAYSASNLSLSNNHISNIYAIAIHNFWNRNMRNMFIFQMFVWYIRYIWIELKWSLHCKTAPVESWIGLS